MTKIFTDLKDCLEFFISWILLSVGEKYFDNHKSSTLFSKRCKIIPQPNDHGWKNQHKNPHDYSPQGSPTTSFPFTEDQCPHIAENYDKSHVDGPTGEIVFSHLGGAHAVKHELEIPANPGKRWKDVINDDGRVAAVEIIFCCAISDI